jgi:pantoate--beta-alanine ligase
MVKLNLKEYKMEILKTVKETHKVINQFKRKGKTIVVVPTMGSLHEGHISLIREAKQYGDIVISTLFVNPKQFGPNEDFERYPRDFERDYKMLEEAGCDLLFAPNVTDMYPAGFSTKLSINGITDILEGKTRPNHYDGVAIVVLKLFNITKADIGIFGQKDYQQFIVIRKMVEELNLDIILVMAPIIRENNGLAMSSRNRYLSSEEFKQAAIMNQSLELAAEAVKQGERNRINLIKLVTDNLLKSNLIKIDYVEIINDITFEVHDKLTSGQRIVILIACWFGSTRLIDNKIIEIH